jgi:tetratricopeptide (TPR) repeat protein
MLALGFLLVALATETVFHAGTATALLWAIGALFGGGFVGFLFSLPKPTEEPAGTGRRWQVNNSLNQISDKLTAVFVGVTLVNAKTIFDHFTHSVKHLAAGLVASNANAYPAAEAFAAGLIVAFILLGLLGTYLLTRLWIAAALQQAEPGGSAFIGTGVNERDLAILENETRSFSEKERSYSGAAKSVAERIALLPMDRMRTWREYAVWGRAKSQFGEHAEAEKAFGEAVQLYPESAALRLEFAVTLFLARSRRRRRTSGPDSISGCANSSPKPTSG